MERTIVKTWKSERSRISAIHEAARVLPPGHWQEFDPFLMMAEDWFQRGAFDDHPHRGIETVTYVISGHLAHYDNKSGHQGTLGPGDVQWMTAGHGVIHNENPVPGELVHSLQLWINLPADQKLMAPRYQDLSATGVPVIDLPGGELRLYSGRAEGIDSPTQNVVPILMVELRLEAKAQYQLQIPADFNGFFYVLEGKGQFGAERTSGAAGDVLWMSREQDSSSSFCTIEADTAVRALAWAGKPLHQPVAAYGPFVMTSMDEIRQTVEDYQAGRFL